MRRYELWPRLAREELERVGAARSAAAATTSGPPAPLPQPVAAAATSTPAAAGTSSQLPAAGWVSFYLRYAVRGPKLWWTDSCCKEREFLMGIFSTLGGACVYNPSDFTPAGLLPMTPILHSLVDSAELCDAACAALSSCAALGFDAEWPPTCRDGAGGRGRVATVQLACDTHAYVFQLRKLVIDGALPPSLAAILLNRAIKKVGVSSAGDATRLLQDYGAATAGVTDIAALAREKALTVVDSYSLAALAARVLRVHLPKPVEIVLSRWDDAKLSAEQLQYAAHDAAACIRVYTALNDGTVAEPPATPAALEMSIEDLESELKRLLSVVEGDGAASSAPSGAATSQAARTAQALRRAALPDQDAAAAASPGAPASDSAGGTAAIARFCSVLLDVLHLMQRYEKGCSTKKDPLFGLFMRKLKEAIFVKNSEDMELLKRWLMLTRGMTAEEVVRMPSAYIHERVRRHIPPPAELALRIIQAVNIFVGLTCADGLLRHTRNDRELLLHSGI
jgi:hypothetical protein